MKETIFKFCHLSLVVHHPDMSDPSINYTKNADQWNKCLRQIFFMIQSEIKYLNDQIKRYNQNPEFPSILITLSSRLCYLIFWDENFWSDKTSSDDQQPSAKKVKRSNKLQSLMNLIEIGGVNKFCWRWFIVFADLLECYTNVLLADDYQPILQLLSDFQVIIQYPIQVKYFIKCCRALLEKEDELYRSTVGSRILNREFCDGIWNKITETTFRLSTANTSVSSEFHSLLALLIKHRKFASMGFIKNVLQTYSTNSIKSSNLSVVTLIAIFETINVDSLENSKQLICDFLTWLHPSNRRICLKSALTNYDQISVANKARITVLCLLTSSEKRILQSEKDEESSIQTEYDQEIREIEKNIQLKSLNTIIEMIQPEVHHEEFIQLPTNVTSVLNEELYDHFSGLVSFDHSGGDVAMENLNKTENIIKLLQNTEFCLEILDNLIKYGALNEEKFKNIIFAKKLKLMLQSIELIFNDLTGQSVTETIDILDSLHAVFAPKFHSFLSRFIRIKESTNVIKWILSKSENVDLKSTKTFELIDLNELEGKERCKAKALTLIANIGEYDDQFLSPSSDLINMDIEFNFESNVDVNILIRILSIFCRHRLSKNRAGWVMQHIMDLCMEHHNNQSISKAVIDLLSNPYKNFNHLSLLKNCMIALQSFLTKCLIKIYSPSVAIKVINQVAHLAQCFNEHLDAEFQNIYLTFGDFIQIPNLNVQLAVIRCMKFLFNTDWLKSSKKNDFTTIMIFHKSIHDSIDLKKLSKIENNSKDYKKNVIAINIHLLSSISSVNYSFRKRCLFSLLEFTQSERVSTAQLKHILAKSCEQMNIKNLSPIDDNLEYLIENWVIKKFEINDFPWMLTKSLTRDEFLQKNKRIFVASILEHNVKLLNDFAEILKTPINDLVSEAYPICLAKLLPFYTQCLRSRKQMAKLLQFQANLHTQLDEYEIMKRIKNHQKEIIESLFLTIWDRDEFIKMFKLSILFNEEDNSDPINYASFEGCIGYVILKNGTEGVCGTSFFERPDYILSVMNAIKTRIQLSIVNEDRLKYIYRYFILFNMEIGYLISGGCTDSHQLSDFRNFLLLDFCYYSMNLIESNDCQFQSIAVLRQFKEVCKKIIPYWSQYFQQHLSVVVTKLIPLCVHNNESILEIAQEILKFLIVDHWIDLKESIELLDDFPGDKIFDNIRKVHKKVKYQNQDICLRFEIDHFLKIKNREVEGLVALKNQLASNKENLIGLYNNLTKMRGFSEDCEKSVIHRLIGELLECVQSDDPKKSHEAAKCLGELGSSDLTTLVLKPNNHSSTNRQITSLSEACINLCSIAIDQLYELLIHKDIEIVKIVYETCYLIARTKIGKKYISEFSIIYTLIRTFLILQFFLSFQEKNPN